MGPKKRTTTASASHRPSAKSSAATPSPPSAVHGLPAPDSSVAVMTAEFDSDCSANQAAIRQECEHALNAVSRRNHNKALRLMNESYQKYENSALIHRIHGNVYMKVAGILGDPTAKQRNLKNAIGSARKAAELSPNLVEFSHFYANLVYETMSEGKDYEEVVAECERALAIEKPNDPAKENPLLQLEEKAPTPEARISLVQQALIFPS